jgi:hypothetical protein
LLDGVVLALLLGELADVDFGVATLDRGLNEFLTILAGGGLVLRQRCGGHEELHCLQKRA